MLFAKRFIFQSIKINLFGFHWQSPNLICTDFELKYEIRTFIKKMIS